MHGQLACSLRLFVSEKRFADLTKKSFWRPSSTSFWGQNHMVNTGSKRALFLNFDYLKHDKLNRYFPLHKQEGTSHYLEQIFSIRYIQFFMITSKAKYNCKKSCKQNDDLDCHEWIMVCYSALPTKKDLVKTVKAVLPEGKTIWHNSEICPTQRVLTSSKQP